MITIFLQGKLKQFGESFFFDALTTADALRLLLVQKRDLAKAINEGKFTVKIGDYALREDELHKINSAEESLHIVPAVGGRKGVGSFVLGAALIGAAFFTGGASMAAWSFGTSMMFAGGVGLMVMGASSLFFKPPRLDANGNGQEQSKSAHFSNLGNNVAHNTVYPVCYGTFYCGSARVSEGVIAVRNNPNEKPKNPIAGQIEEFKREYYRGIPARDPSGRPYPTDFDNDSVKARNYKIV